MTTKQVNVVYETYDYSAFKTIDGNRSVNAVHVKRLKDSFNKGYLLSPILINKKFEIIDGQHRYFAAKSLGLPVRYIMVLDYGLREVQMLNENSKNWGKEQYLDSYCEIGHTAYVRFKEFMLHFPELGMAACEILLVLF